MSDELINRAYARAEAEATQAEKAIAAGRHVEARERTARARLILNLLAEGRTAEAVLRLMPKGTMLRTRAPWRLQLLTIAEQLRTV